MRILILSNVPPATVGGAEVQALHLARHWASSGHNVMVAGNGNTPFTDKNLKIERIPTLQRYRWLRASSYIVSALWMLWRYRNKYDVIYCRFLKEQAFVASLAKLIFRLRQPLVACPACASTGGEAELIKMSKLRHIWLALLKNNVTTVNAMSQQIEAEMLDLGFHPTQISNISNGVVIPPAHPRDTNSTECISALFIGRLTHQKGLDTLLEAMHTLKLGGYNLQLHLVGDGPLHKILVETTERLNLSDRIFFEGPVAPSYISEKLASADLFILPSRFEGMPGALLEAIAHGVPAVVTRVSGSEEVIDPSIGWTVPAGDSSALADAIQSALVVGKEGLHTMGDRAREKACQQYDIGIIAQRYERLFIKLTHESKMGR